MSAKRKTQSNASTSTPSIVRKSKTIDYSGQAIQSTRKSNDSSFKAKEPGLPSSDSKVKNSKIKPKGVLTKFFGQSSPLQTEPRSSESVDKTPNIQDIKKLLAPYVEKEWVHHAARLKHMVKLQKIPSNETGEVWRVFDEEGKEFYALKEIKREHFQSQKDFERVVFGEIKPLLTLVDANDSSLLRIYLINLSKDSNICYILKELSKGTLQEYANYRKFEDPNSCWEENELEYILWNLAQQVTALKKLGLYHRDIKPSNIIRSAKDNQLKLSDFGSACIANSGVQRLGIAGTRFYMAPELPYPGPTGSLQCDYDPYLSDLFSIGATILKLCEGSSLERKDLYGHLEDTFKDFNPNLYKYVKGLVDRKSPVREVLAKEILEMEPQIKKWSKIEKRDSDIEYKGYLLKNTLESEESSVKPSFCLDLFKLDDAINIIEENLERVDPPLEEFRKNEWEIALLDGYLKARRYKEGFQQAQKILKNVEAQGDSQQSILIKANVYFSLGKMMLEFDKYRLAINYFGNSLKLKKQRFGESNEQVAILYWYIANVCIKEGKFTEATNAVTKSLEAVQKSPLPIKNKITFDNYITLGKILEHERKLQSAIEGYMRARDFGIRKYGETHPLVAEQYYNIGKIYLDLNNSNEANENFQKCLVITKKYHGERSLSLANTYSEIASSYDQKSMLNEALEYISKCLDIYKEDEDEEGNLFKKAGAYLLYSNILFKKGQYNEAEENLLEAINIKEGFLEDGPQQTQLAFDYALRVQIYNALGKTNFINISTKKIKELDLQLFEPNQDIIMCLLRIGSTFLDINDLESAKDYVSNALDTCNKICPEDWKTKSRCLEKLALIYIQKENYDEAINELNTALYYQLNKMKEADGNIALTYNYLGKAFQMKKNYDQAKENFEKSLEELKNHSPSENYILGLICIDMGDLLKIERRFEEALTQFKKAFDILGKVFVETEPRIVKCKQEIKELQENLAENEF